MKAYEFALSLINKMTGTKRNLVFSPPEQSFPPSDRAHWRPRSTQIKLTKPSDIRSQRNNRATNAPNERFVILEEDTVKVPRRPGRRERVSRQRTQGSQTGGIEDTFPAFHRRDVPPRDGLSGNL